MVGENFLTYFVNLVAAFSICFKNLFCRLIRIPLRGNPMFEKKDDKGFGMCVFLLRCRSSVGEILEQVPKSCVFFLMHQDS